MAQFEKGQSGNPGGRPKGSGRTHELRKRLQDRAPEIIDKVIENALDGDKAALKLCMERILPPLKPEDTASLDPGADPNKPIINLGRQFGELIQSDQLTVGQAKEILSAAHLRIQLLEMEKKTIQLGREKRVMKSMQPPTQDNSTTE